MPIHLDHLMVPSRNRVAAARLLANVLGVPWAETGIGRFSPVYVSDGLTLDFDQREEPFPVEHYCFRVSQEEFDAILGRIKAAGMKYRSTPHGPVDMKINREEGGSIAYWSEPDGHVWEILTVSYTTRVSPRPRRINHGRCRDMPPRCSGGFDADVLDPRRPRSPPARSCRAKSSWRASLCRTEPRLP